MHGQRDLRLRRQGLIGIAMVAGLCACAEETVYTPPPPDFVTTERELEDDMRELWTTRVVWTRTVIVGELAGLPDAADAAERLLANQDDIADAIRPLYGDAAADELAQLLRENVLLMLDAAHQASIGEPEQARHALYASADAIARFLADLGPSWTFEELRALLRLQVDLTFAEIDARLVADWAGEIAAFDEVLTHALRFSDVLTDGIVEQLPDRVQLSEESARDEQLHRAMRALWHEHVIWTRVYVIAAIAGLPETEFVAERLLQNQDDIGEAVGAFYGEDAGEALAFLLREHITLAADVVYAASIDDGPGTQAAIAKWRANADAIAAFLADASPYLRQDHVRALMHTHLDQLIAVANARLAEDWVRDIETYDEIVSHILRLADLLSDAIATQFPEAPIL